MQERKKDFGSYLWLFSFYSWMSIVLRSILAVFDWRTILRRVRFKQPIDTVFISNMRDDIDRKRFLGKTRPKAGFLRT